MKRHYSFVGMSLLSLVVAAYAIGMYGFGPGALRLPSEMQENFKSHSHEIGAHIFASGLALLLGPFQFSSTLRTRCPRLHRFMGRTYLGVAVLVGGLAGLYMSAFAFGGIVAKCGFACLAIAWLFTGYKGYAAVRAGNLASHRRWMIRNFALTFAAVTLRLYIPSSFILAVPFELAYPVIAWLCWVPNLLTAELLVRAAPNPSIERTSPGKPGVASHVKR